MKVTKYVHACVLVEEGADRVLFDPGTFSFMDGRVTPELFKDVKLIVITHNHQDHYDPEAIKQIVALSGAAILTTPEVVAALTEAGVEAAFSTDTEYALGDITLKAIPAQHEAILADALPQNYGYLVNGRLLHPGDSYADSLTGTGAEALLLPVVAPWATQLDTFAFAKKAGARIAIPIHDGYVEGYFREFTARSLTPRLADADVEYRPLMEPGDSTEL